MLSQTGIVLWIRASVLISVLVISVVPLRAMATTEIVEVQVSESSDDAEENASGRVGLTSSDLELVFDKDDQVVGIRFNNVDIPPDSIISTAYVQFTVDETGSSPTTLQIHAQRNVNPPTFANTQGEISGRPTTLTSVSWSPAAWNTVGSAGPDQRTPNLAAIIQEIIDLPGWNAGNSVVILVRGSGERTAESFNGSAGAAPVLHVEFEPTVGGDRAPDVSLTSPADGTTVSEGTSLTFSATAIDEEDGDISSSLAWESSLDGPIEANGPSISVVLSPGSHVITATAVDSANQADSDSITVTVTPSGGVSLILETAVPTGADDAEEDTSGRVNLTSSDLELMLDRSLQTVGLRFPGIDITPGAVVTDAWIQFTVDEATTGETNIVIQGDADANAAPFENASFNISSRSRTLAQAEWPVAAWPTVGAAGINQRTPNLADIVNEVVNSTGWTNGNALAFIITGNGKRVAESTNGSAAPILHIEYFDGVPEATPLVSVTGPGDGTTVESGTSLNFSATANDAEDGDLSSAITWLSSIDGSLGSGASVSATLSLGTHTVTASATDSAGKTGSDSIAVVVTPLAGNIPLVSITSPADGASFDNVTPITFSASATDDEDGDLSSSINWTSSISGPLGTGASLTTALSVGSHTITASAADTAGQSGSDSITVTVSSVGGALPTVSVTGPTDGTTVIEGTAITFTGSASDAEDGSLSANIDWSSSLTGTLGSGASLTRILSVGTHTVTATVTDSGGQTASDSITVHVTSLAGSPPEVSITSPANETSISEGTEVTFTGAATDNEDGSLSDAIEWISSLDGALGTGASVTATLSVGVHTVTAGVTDAGGQEASDQVSVTVTPTGGTAQTITRQITTGNDDVEEFSNGNVYTNSSDLELVYDDYSQGTGGEDYNQTVGMRFNNIDIEPGSVVTAAWIQFTVDETSGVATNLVIQGVASPNATAFSTADFGVSSLPRTASQVSWAPNAWNVVGAAGADQQTPDLATVINEIITDANWTYGNSLAIVITGTGERIAESYDGSPAAAPVLHVEFVDSGANRRPTVDAGNDSSVTLPNNTVSLNGSVTDDGLPEGSSLTINWSRVGGTGSGSVNFANASAVDTTVTFSADPGTYILQLSASDGEYTSTDEVTINVKSPSSGGQIVSISQANYFDTGFANLTSPLAIPATDPAGVVYHPPSGRLFIADSEINEISSAFSIVQANIFQTPTTGGTTLDQWDTTQRTGNEPTTNREPTGIAYCENDGHFYVSNDDQRYIYRYAYDGFNLTAVDAFSVSATIPDAEGVTCDPATGRIYVVGGVDLTIGVLRYNNGFSLETVISLPQTAGSNAGIPDDAEGIAFDPGSGHLFVLSGPDRAIFEYTTAGVFIKKLDIGSFSPRPVAAQGLSIGVASDDPNETSFYIADGMIDNDSNANERDGRIFEARIYRE